MDRVSRSLALATSSDRYRIGIERAEQSIPGPVLELDVARQLDRAGADALRVGFEARQRLAVTIVLAGLDQHAPHHDDAIVGRAEIFPRAVLDGTHALLQRGVLHGDALDAAVIGARFLR